MTMEPRKGVGKGKSTRSDFDLVRIKLCCLFLIWSDHDEREMISTCLFVNHTIWNYSAKDLSNKNGQIQHNISYHSTEPINP